MNIQGLCQRQKPWKKLQDNRMNRQTDTLTNILTTVFACQIFANDILPSYARATDISVCLPMHIQGLCQRQNPWKKLQDNQTNRQTD